MRDRKPGTKRQAGGGGKGRRDGSSGRFGKEKVAPSVRARALRLEKENGLSRSVAFQVAMGRQDLNDVLARMAFDNQVESLMRRHGLQKSLATQVVTGDADLDAILLKREMASHFEQNRDRSVFDAAQASGLPVKLALHGATQVSGTISTADSYEVVLNEPDGSQQTIHKLHVKFASMGSDADRALAKVQVGPKAKESQGPIERPQDRVRLSNRWLFALMKRGDLVEVTTLEGDVIHGTLTWMGRWELGLDMDGKGLSVVVMRHAISSLQSLSEPE